MKTPNPNTPQDTPQDRPQDEQVTVRTDDSRRNSTDPALPHERDQGAVPVTGPISPKVAQAYADLVSGQVDTDMRATPGLDAERRKRLVPGSS